MAGIFMALGKLTWGWGMRVSSGKKFLNVLVLRWAIDAGVPRARGEKPVAAGRRLLGQRDMLACYRSRRCNLHVETP